MADHDRRRGEDQQAADLIADLALYPGGGDGSSSSNQSSPSNNDHSLSPRSTAQDGSFFFDSATAFSLFSPSAGQIGPGADLPWSTSVAFSTPLTPAVVHVASPVAGFAATPNRAAGFGGNAAMSRDFWEASPGIPSPMGMGEVAQQPQQMIGMDASSSPTHSAEISFGSLVAEDQCGSVLVPTLLSVRILIRPCLQPVFGSLAAGFIVRELLLLAASVHLHLRRLERIQLF